MFQAQGRAGSNSNNKNAKNKHAPRLIHHLIVDTVRSTDSHQHTTTDCKSLWSTTKDTRWMGGQGWYATEDTLHVAPLSYIQYRLPHTALGGGGERAKEKRPVRKKKRDATSEVSEWFRTNESCSGCRGRGCPGGERANRLAFAPSSVLVCACSLLRGGGLYHTDAIRKSGVRKAP